LRQWTCPDDLCCAFKRSEATPLLFVGNSWKRQNDGKDSATFSKWSATGSLLRLSKRSLMRERLKARRSRKDQSLGTWESDKAPMHVGSWAAQVVHEIKVEFAYEASSVQGRRGDQGREGAPLHLSSLSAALATECRVNADRPAWHRLTPTLRRAPCIA
jgi:hypothetical protein